jgi:hypothetical protein
MPDNGSVLGDFGAAYQGNGVTKQCSAVATILQIASY